MIGTAIALVTIGVFLNNCFSRATESAVCKL